uniref:Uncharacterized protein n=1 Tax=Anguilla anguilla TaxID=7936 RepID=A0A0E9QMJ2_ANGAN
MVLACCTERNQIKSRFQPWFRFLASTTPTLGLCQSSETLHKGV